MPRFFLYLGGDSKGIPFDMPDQKLLEDFKAWLKDKKKPDHFIGESADKQPIVVNFQLIGLIKGEAPSSPPEEQRSPALAGRRLGGP